MPKARYAPCWRISSSVSEDRRLLVVFKPIQHCCGGVARSEVFLVDDAHDGIFAKASNSGVRVPVDGRSVESLLEFRGLLLLKRKVNNARRRRWFHPMSNLNI